MFPGVQLMGVGLKVARQEKRNSATIFSQLIGIRTFPSNSEIEPKKQMYKFRMPPFVATEIYNVFKLKSRMVI